MLDSMHTATERSFTPAVAHMVRLGKLRIPLQDRSTESDRKVSASLHGPTNNVAEAAIHLADPIRYHDPKLLNETNSSKCRPNTPTSIICKEVVSRRNTSAGASQATKFDRDTLTHTMQNGDSRETHCDRPPLRRVTGTRCLYSNEYYLGKTEVPRDPKDHNLNPKRRLRRVDGIRKLNTNSDELWEWFL